jgi:threonine/homoserine/homoserine lactone efflux protein
MNILLRGLIIGVSIAAPVGPIGVLCIRRTLANGRTSGLFSGLGAATADACYGSVAAFGLTFISSLLVGQQFWFRLIGGAFLCYLGVKTWMEKPASIVENEKGNSEELVQTPNTIGNESPIKRSLEPNKEPGNGKGLLADYLSTFFLTVTNPMTILSFAAIFAGLGIASSSGSPVSALILVLGVFLGSGLWWLTLSSLVNLFRARFLKPVALRWVNRISGTIITGFGIVALASIFRV